MLKNFGVELQSYVSLSFTDFLPLRISYVTDEREIFLLLILQVPASNLVRNTGYINLLYSLL
jgi:hypothetical protein